VTQKHTDQGEFIVEYTTKDIMDKLDEHNKKFNTMLKKQDLTNGNVIRNKESIKTIQKHSIGIWIRNNPYKFTSIMLVCMSFFISDVRQPVIKFIIGLFL